MRKVSLPVILALFALLLLPNMLVMAQSGLDSSLDSNFGAYALEPGFLPDPYIIPLLSGGNVDVSRLSLGANCGGNVTSQPDVVLEWGSASQYMHIFFVGMGDTTLIVELPDGSYACNDDTVGTDPSVDILNPTAGSYAVWVGTFGSTQDYIPGYLMVSEFEDSLPGNIITNIPNFVTTYEDFEIDSSGSSETTPATPVPSNTSSSTGELNPDGESTYGTSTLRAGFSPDPATVLMSSGGDVDIPAANLGIECRGFAAENPDYRVEWSGAGDLLRLFFVSDGDTTLIVRTPSGDFACNDDTPGGGLNPLVDIEAPASGTYDIWVGTFGVEEIIPGTLYITGSESNDPASVR